MRFTRRRSLEVRTVETLRVGEVESRQLGPHTGGTDDGAAVESSTPLLQLEGISKRLGGHLAVDDVSLDVNGGDVISIVGPSGAGKSSLLRCVNFLTPPDSGRVLLNGQLACPSYRPGRSAGGAELSNLRRRIGMVFQGFELFPHLSVRQNINLAQMKALRRDKAVANARTESLLRRVGMLSKIDDYPSQCSGGQKQRVAIARALALDPEIMLFDEPTSALDPEVGVEVLEVMRSLAADGMTMLIVTHEMHFAEQVSSEVVVMADSRIIERGTPTAIFHQPQHRRTQAFLGAVMGR